LDSKGLVALWREALLAKKVLEGKTSGYKHHPQLVRFKMSEQPVNSINQYLKEVFREALRREFNFDGEKIDWGSEAAMIHVTRGQIDYEISHLLNKLKVRDNAKYTELKSIREFECHPLFNMVEGEIEEWEITVNLKQTTAFSSSVKKR
jgi:hypothetical protein